MEMTEFNDDQAENDDATERSAQNSLTVPDAASSAAQAHRQRRCSARLLSVNVREALKNLRQREHKARVTALVQRNAHFYQRQRLCECVSLLTGLGLFSVFSLYVVFAYGFHFGQRQPFTLSRGDFPSKITRNEVRDETNDRFRFGSRPN